MIANGRPPVLQGPDSAAWLVDAVGVAHDPDPNARIVCLVPSITELLCSLGLAPLLVGRTGFCIHPRDTLKSVPRVGGTKDVNLEAVRRLAPSHLIVNIDENEKSTVHALAADVPHIVVTHPQHPLDNLALFRLLGGLFGAQEKAAVLCAAFEEAYQRIAQTRWTERRVLYLIWKDPWMTVAPHTYIGGMLALVGWRQVPLADARRYPEVDLDELAPTVDMVLLSSEPYRFGEAHRAHLEARHPAQEVRLVDGEMLSWYGSRAIAGLDYLADLAQGSLAA